MMYLPHKSNNFSRYQQLISALGIRENGAGIGPSFYYRPKDSQAETERRQSEDYRRNPVDILVLDGFVQAG
jgi:hypothetical protein